MLAGILKKAGKKLSIGTKSVPLAAKLERQLISNLGKARNSLVTTINRKGATNLLKDSVKFFNKARRLNDTDLLLLLRQKAQGGMMNILTDRLNMSRKEVNILVNNIRTSKARVEAVTGRQFALNFSLINNVEAKNIRQIKRHLNEQIVENYGGKEHNNINLFLIELNEQMIKKLGKGLPDNLLYSDYIFNEITINYYIDMLETSSIDTKPSRNIYDETVIVLAGQYNPKSNNSAFYNTEIINNIIEHLESEVSFYNNHK